MRVYAPLDDPAVIELDQVAAKRGISRAQLIINAIDSYLHQPEPSTEELDKLRIGLDQKDSELDQMRIKPTLIRINLNSSWIKPRSNWINRILKHLISRTNWSN